MVHHAKMRIMVLQTDVDNKWCGKLLMNGIDNIGYT